MQVKFVDAAGLSTRCLIAGSPDHYPLLLLHGFGGTADVWVRNIDALGDEFYVIAVDMLNCGFTAFDEGSGPPQARTVAHLLALVEALGLRQFCPVGTSYGGLIAALLYFAAPERVNKLILNGSATCFNDDAALTATLTTMLRNFTPLMNAPTPEGCRGTFTKSVLDPASIPDEILLTMATAYARPGMKATWERDLHGLLDLEAGRAQSVRDRLEKLDVETLVLWGREDPGAIYATAVAAMPRLPNARLVTFEKCGHKPMFEHPVSYNDVVRRFLRDGLAAIPPQLSV